MSLLILVFIIATLLFGFVLLFGAPYLPTLRPQIVTALDMLDLRPGDTMLEIGSGDGRVMRMAAARGWNVVGYELNPVLVLVSYVVTIKYRKQIRIVWGDAFRAKWPEADGVYIFGLPKIMPKLHTKIIQNNTKSLRLVSFGFVVPKKDPVRQAGGISLYEYRPK